MPIRNQPQSAQAANAPNLETGVRERPSEPLCTVSAAEQDERDAASRARDDDDPTTAARESQYRQRDEALNSLIVRDDLTREGVLPEGDDLSRATRGSRLRGRDARESAGAASDEPPNELTVPEDETPGGRDEPKDDPTADDGRESGFRERDESDDDAYELQDHEFTLEPEDATIEIATQLGTPPPISLVPPPLPPLPPLPPWAAASRALLDNSLDALDEHNDRTIEIPPPPVVNDASKSADGGGSAWPADDWSDLAEPSTSATPAIPRPVRARSSDRDAKSLSLREQLITVTRHKRAREVYLQEVERALASANGRLRGQAFRIAELEEELHETRAAAIAAALSAKRPRKLRKTRAATIAAAPSAKRPRKLRDAPAKTRAKAPTKSKRARPDSARKASAQKKGAPSKRKRTPAKRTAPKRRTSAKKR